MIFMHRVKIRLDTCPGYTNPNTSNVSNRYVLNCGQGMWYESLTWPRKTKYIISRPELAHVLHNPEEYLFPINYIPSKFILEYSTHSTGVISKATGNIKHPSLNRLASSLRSGISRNRSSFIRIWKSNTERLLPAVQSWYLLFPPMAIILQAWNMKFEVRNLDTGRNGNMKYDNYL